MKTVTAKFGALTGFETKYGVITGGDAFWNNFETFPASGHRCMYIGRRRLANPTVSTDSGLTDIANFYANPRALGLMSKSRMGSDLHVEIVTVDPDTSTGSASVTGVGTVGTGDDAVVWSDADKPKNARWKLSVIANMFPGKLPLSVVVPGNEVNANPNRYTAYAPENFGVVIGAFSNCGKVDKTTALTRLATLQQAMYEELKTPNRVYTVRKHPSVVSSFNTAGGSLRASADQAFNCYDLYTHDNGIILKNCEVISLNFHNYQSAFDTSGVANNTRSPWHVWTALQQGQALAGTGAVHPLYFGEYGDDSGTDIEIAGVEEQMPSDLRSAWNDLPTAANRASRFLVKTHRLGMACVTTFYWACSYTILYAHNSNSPSYSMSFCPESLGFTPFEPQWTALKGLFDPANYLVTGRGPWVLPIVAKPFTDFTSIATQATGGFHYAPTWAILANMYVPEVSDPMSSSQAPWYEWRRATITDNQIAFIAPTGGQGNQTNRACRPVILPGHGRYKVTCTVTGNTGTARLIARGYDALNGLANVTTSTAAASATLTATFTTVPHNVKNFPNLPKAAVVLECTAAAAFQDISLAPA